MIIKLIHGILWPDCHPTRGVNFLWFLLLGFLDQEPSKQDHWTQVENEKTVYIFVFIRIIRYI